MLPKSRFCTPIFGHSAGSTKKLTGPLSDPTEIPPPPNRETDVAIPLWHCVFCGIAETIAATPPLLYVRMAYRSPKPGLRGVLQKEFASEAYRATGGIA